MSSNAKKAKLAEEDDMAVPQDLPLSAFEKRILELAKQFPKGLPNKIMQNDSPDVPGTERAAAINNLLGMGLLELYKQGSELLYKIKTSTNEPAQMKDADKEERVVYEIIKEAGNKGIWIRDIRFKSNLLMPQLNKIVKSLETNRLIKAVKSVAAAKKKVYMIYELEPDRSLTGGAWYSDQDFESEFVTVLNEQCLKYLSDKLDNAKARSYEVGPRVAKQMATASLEEVWEFIQNLGISKVALSHEDIESILETLIYDNKIERVIKGDKKIFMATESFGIFPGFAEIPCGVCPVAKLCSEEGDINPRDCEYMAQWLASTF